MALRTDQPDLTSVDSLISKELNRQKKAKTLAQNQSYWRKKMADPHTKHESFFIIIIFVANLLTHINQEIP